MEKQHVSRNQLVSALLKSPHGKLDEYVPMGRAGMQYEPEFMAHLIAWNESNGQIRDSKVALPVIALASGQNDYTENALAHLALLDPRNLVRAIRFGKQIKTPGNGRAITKLVERYLRVRENSPKWFERTVMQHRASMKELYALMHIKPGLGADSVLFKGRKVGVFKKIAELGSMSPEEAAGTIMQHKIPFLVAAGAMGAKMKDPAMVQALIKSMSPAELINNTKMLEKLGVMKDRVLKATYDAQLQIAAEAPKGKGASLFKATKAAQQLGDSALAGKMRNLQEKQIAKAGGIEGDWLVLADKSGSMKTAIEAGRHIAATLARMVKGNVYLIFFDSGCSKVLDVTGQTYEAILAHTKGVTSGGGTDCGIGIEYAIAKGWNIDGIALVSDGEDGGHSFAHRVARLNAKRDTEVAVYHYDMQGGRNVIPSQMQTAGINYETFNLRGGTVDYYAMPNMVQTMRVNRFSLADEIMETPLLTLDGVFKK